MRDLPETLGSTQKSMDSAHQAPARQPSPSPAIRPTSMAWNETKCCGQFRLGAIRNRQHLRFNFWATVVPCKHVCFLPVFALSLNCHRFNRATDFFVDISQIIRCVLQKPSTRWEHWIHSGPKNSLRKCRRKMISTTILHFSEHPYSIEKSSNTNDMSLKEWRICFRGEISSCGCFLEWPSTYTWLKDARSNKTKGNVICKNYCKENSSNNSTSNNRVRTMSKLPTMVGTTQKACQRSAAQAQCSTLVFLWIVFTIRGHTHYRHRLRHPWFCNI